MIERNAKAQTRLIEDMLDVSRIVTGKLTFNLETLDLATVIGAALDSVRPAAQAKNIQLVEQVDPTTSPIQGDAQRLQQVIWNLLSNAIKFTPPGGVVRIALKGSRSRVEVTVSDTEAGIRREVLPFVFDRAARRIRPRRACGLGLGLAIVRHVIELHGGTVEAHSAGEEGRPSGSSCRSATCRSRRHGTPARGGRSRLAGAWEPLLRGRRVLVVDDHADALQLIGGILGIRRVRNHDRLEPRSLRCPHAVGARRPDCRHRVAGGGRLRAHSPHSEPGSGTAAGSPQLP